MALSNISREVCQDLLEKLNVNQIVDSNDLVKVKTQHANMAKLSVLYKQLMFVKKEIEEVVEDIRINSIINDVEIKCKKYANQKYFLYKKLEDDNLYFSRLSPRDYNYEPKDMYLGTYLLDMDYTWKKLE